MKKLYKFYWDYGRQGSLSGMFIADEKDVENAIGERANFGEALGKHSCVDGTIEKDDITEVKVSEQTVKEMEEILGKTISGKNPLHYIRYVCCECGSGYQADECNYLNKDNERVCCYCAADIGEENFQIIQEEE